MRLRVIVMNDFVTLQPLLECEGFVAWLALERARLFVSQDVLIVVSWIEINAIAFSAVVTSYVRIVVDLFVTIEKRWAWERLGADDACVVFLLGVCENVLGEIVLREEGFLATFAYRDKNLLINSFRIILDDLHGWLRSRVWFCLWISSCCISGKLRSHMLQV